MCLAALLISLMPCALADELNTSVTTRLKADLAYLASDDLKGRDVGSEGIAEAGQFIEKRFQELGIETELFETGPYQEFSLPGPAEIGDADSNRLVFEGTQADVTPALGQNFTSLALGGNGEFSGGLVFAGYGITAPDLGYDDYKDVDVEGKVVIVIRKEPQQQQADSIFEGTRSSQYAFFSSKELNAAMHKAAALIIVNDAVTASRDDSVMAVTAAGSPLSDQTIPTFHCQRSLIDPILTAVTGMSLLDYEQAIDKDLEPQSVEIKGVKVTGEAKIKDSRIPVRNVIGYLPGTGRLKEEFVVVGAHYDHVGMGGRGSLAPGTIAIHNGADDNGSGTVTMLEVARRMSENKAEDRRGIIFMAFTAEERGLLGSKHYVRNPRWPLEDTVAMVNMDMVGRLNENVLTVYGTGTAKEFDGLVDDLNEEFNFALDKRVAGFGPSDHASFYEAKIPVFHFFTGLHNDYHRPSDDVDKVNYDGMTRIAGMIAGAVEHIATAEKRPSYIQTTARANVGRAPRRARAVLGVQLDLDFDGDGVRIDAVSEGGPASEAGLEVGDVIVKLDDDGLESVRDLRRFMGGQKPDNEISVTVLRGEEEETVTVKLGRG